MENALPEVRNRVFVVEDSDPIRERLVALLGDIEGVSVVGEANSVVAGVEGILRTRPESVVLDIQLADGSGVEVLRQTCTKAPEVVFVVLTNHANAQYRRTCMEAGATHFFDKNTEIAKVMEVIAALGVAPLAAGKNQNP